MFFLRSFDSEVFDSSIPTNGVLPFPLPVLMFLLTNCSPGGEGDGELWI